MAEPIERRRDAAVAGHSGDAARARPYLGDDDPMVRASALRGLARAGDLTARELLAALEDPAPAVRMAALELGVDREDMPVATAAARLGDGDRRVVEAAAWACGEKISAQDAAPQDTAAPRAAPQAAAAQDTAAQYAAAVVEELAGVAGSHEDPLCRESAIAALGAIGDPAGLPAVLAGLDDRPEIRRRAVIALAPFDGPEVEAALVRASTDRDRQVRAAAAELRRGPSVGDTE